MNAKTKHDQPYHREGDERYAVQPYVGWFRATGDSVKVAKVRLVPADVAGPGATLYTAAEVAEMCIARNVHAPVKAGVTIQQLKGALQMGTLSFRVSGNLPPYISIGGASTKKEKKAPTFW